MQMGPVTGVSRPIEIVIITITLLQLKHVGETLAKIGNYFESEVLNTQFI